MACTESVLGRKLMSFRPFSCLGIVILLLGIVLAKASVDLQVVDSPAWENHGGGLLNQRLARRSLITSENVRKLKLKWSVYTGANITATPSVKDNVVYVPSWDGFLTAACASNGTVIWRQNLIQVARLPSTVSVAIARATPTIAGNLLIIGLYTAGYLLALNKFSGTLVWSSLLDSQAFAGVTMSGTAFRGALYIGTTSREEVRAVGCCTFQGSFYKIDVATGNIMWRTKMLPSNGGVAGLYAGAAIWGSSPAIDQERSLVYIATGNTYSTPPDVVTCELAQRNKTTPDVPDPCIAPTDHSESVLALDLNSGRIMWSTHLGAYDTWVFACAQTGNPNCPAIPGPDYDFGQAPMLLRGIRFTNPTTSGDILVVAQKSGFVYGLRPDDGAKVWTKVAGPGGLSGGSMWGSATDGRTVFVAIVNTFKRVFTLLPSKQTTTGGAWVAMDPSNGEILWSTPSPDLLGPPVGPVSVSNDLLFATTHSAHGKLYALDTKSGNIVWTNTPNGSVLGGFSIVNGCAYVGEGNTLLGGITPGKFFYGFCL